MKKLEILKSMGIDEMVAGAAEDGWEFGVYVVEEDATVTLHLPALEAVADMTTADGMVRTARANSYRIGDAIQCAVNSAALDAGLNASEYDAWTECLEFADAIVNEAADYVFAAVSEKMA